MNRKEFENIVPQVRPVMVRTGREFFGNDDDAEDVAQDGLMRLWTYCEKLDKDRNIEALAIRVAKNICVEKYKRRQMRVMEPIEEAKLLDTHSADSAIIATETIDEIDSAILHLSPREQQLVKKRYIEDQTAEEIANETGIAKPSVKSMLSTAKSKLIKYLTNNETKRHT